MTDRPFPDIADHAAPARWLAACPVHAATPLRLLPDLAAELGWAALHVKDEAGRMGLGSFKALGGAYAVLHLLTDRLRPLMGREPVPDDLRGPVSREVAAGMTVCCASAGNHGLSVAAGAVPRCTVA